MAKFRLNSTTGEQSVDLNDGQSVLVGRAVTSDLPVYDSTVSRRHAEVTHTPHGLTVKDLGSSNGTFVNGSRIAEATVSDGDIVTFGKVAFNIIEVVASPAAAAN